MISCCLLEEDVIVVDYDVIIEGVRLTLEMDLGASNIWFAIQDLLYEEMEEVLDEVVEKAHDLFDLSDSVKFIRETENYLDGEGNWNCTYRELIVPAKWME
jgi:hypothetical protein